MSLLFREQGDETWLYWREGFKGNAAADTEAFDAPETKDVGPAGAQRGSKETELDRWRLFWVWQEESEGEVDNSQQYLQFLLWQRGWENINL